MAREPCSLERAWKPFREHGHAHFGRHAVLLRDVVAADDVVIPGRVGELFGDAEAHGQGVDLAVVTRAVEEQVDAGIKHASTSMHLDEARPSALLAADAEHGRSGDQTRLRGEGTPGGAWQKAREQAGFSRLLAE